MRRSLVEQDEYLYDRYVLRPQFHLHVVPRDQLFDPEGTKTLFAVDVIEFETVRIYRFQDTRLLELDSTTCPARRKDPRLLIRHKDRVGRAPAKDKRLCMVQFCASEPCRRLKLCLTPRIKFIF
ncbi:hypothetical protein AVEN_186781-1 [Araneus ventricosus]|uniref:Uncharacterized protein n=1 Tax=Araneus ventricosus TaxID=182803 RepID=A0A4Y2UQD9_ARAVE|nr:hypothetical protein AVEN_186781-1 [Araneus ventricosus]